MIRVFGVSRLCCRLVVFVGALLCLSGCSRREKTGVGQSCPIRVIDPAELRSAHANQRLNLPRYWTTDAVWLSLDPILVGAEYDFASALALEFGAGIAARRRQQAAGATAKALEALGRFELASTLSSVTAQTPELCESLRQRRLGLYGMLFGDNDAHLQVVLNLDVAPGESGAVTQLAAVSDVHPMRGPVSWLGNGGETVRRALRSSVGAIAQLAAFRMRAHSYPVGSARVECAIGGHEAWRGYDLVSSEGSSLGLTQHGLITPGPNATLVFCADPVTPDRNSPVSTSADTIGPRRAARKGANGR